MAKSCERGKLKNSKGRCVVKHSRTLSKKRRACPPGTRKGSKNGKKVCRSVKRSSTRRSGVRRTGQKASGKVSSPFRMSAANRDLADLDAMMLPRVRTPTAPPMSPGSPRLGLPIRVPTGQTPTGRTPIEIMSRGFGDLLPAYGPIVQRMASPLASSRTSPQVTLFPRSPARLMNRLEQEAEEDVEDALDLEEEAEDAEDPDMSRALTIASRGQLAAANAAANAAVTIEYSGEEEEEPGLPPAFIAQQEVQAREFNPKMYCTNQKNPRRKLAITKKEYDAYKAAIEDEEIGLLRQIPELQDLYDTNKLLNLFLYCNKGKFVNEAAAKLGLTPRDAIRIWDTIKARMVLSGGKTVQGGKTM